MFVFKSLQSPRRDTRTGPHTSRPYPASFIAPHRLRDVRSEKGFDVTNGFDNAQKTSVFSVFAPTVWRAYSVTRPGTETLRLSRTT